MKATLTTLLALLAGTTGCAPAETRAMGGAGVGSAGLPGTGGGLPPASGGAPSAPSGAGGGLAQPTGNGGALRAAGAPGTGGSGGGAGTDAGGSDDDGSGTCKTATSLTPCGTNPNPCNIHSGYAGDEYCMRPPPPGKGIQIHFGPSNYTDPAEVAKYVLKPGQEVNSYAVVKVPTAEDRWFSHAKIQMRPGSHHVVDSVVTGDGITEGLVDGTQCPGDMAGTFPGTQTLVEDSPPGGIPAPENVGLGVKLPAASYVCVNHHGYNFTTGDTLREVWINVWFVDAAEVTQEAKGIFLSAGPYMGIPPKTTQVLTYTAEVPADGRILSLLGHRHVWTDRFAVFKNEEVVYDSYDWRESPGFDYDSITTNPAPDPANKKDGAFSGDLVVKKGDKIRIECDVNNTSDSTITFKNQLYGGEMCLLFGAAVGTEIIAAF